MAQVSRRSDLCLAAIDEEFGAGDVARVGRCEEDGGTRDLIWIADTPERHRGSHIVEQALLLRSVGTRQIDKAGRLDRAWADDVHANPTGFQVESPAPGEVAHPGLPGAVRNFARSLTLD